MQGLYRILGIYLLLNNLGKFDLFNFKIDSHLHEVRDKNYIPRKKVYYQNQLLNQPEFYRRNQGDFYGCRNSKIYKEGLELRIKNYNDKKFTTNEKSKKESRIQKAFDKKIKSKRYSKRHNLG